MIMDHRLDDRQGGFPPLARSAMEGMEGSLIRAVFAEGGAEALEHDAAERDVRVRDDRHETNAGVREEAAQAVGLVERHRS